MFELPSIPTMFVGRREELHRLRNQIGDDRRLPKIIGITGPAGIGKSALAIQFLKDLSERFNPLWMSSSLIETNNELFSEILNRVRTAKRESLIVIDHTEGLERNIERFCRELLGIKRLRAVLITSRMIERAIFDVDRLELSGLPPPGRI